MSYCPKCDMEFIDGITVCSDCGGPLMDTEEAFRIKEQEKLRKDEEKNLKHREALGLNRGDEGQDELSDSNMLPQEEIKKAAGMKAENRAYIPKRQRYEDMKSSISAFFMLGGVFLAFGILCLLDIIVLPLDKGPATLFEIVLTAMGAGCLIVAAFTKKSADRMIQEADAEEAQTKMLVSWFTEAYTGRETDEKLLLEDPSLDENELYLKRFELIQDLLTTAHDLPDASYVDYISEEIYGKLYENK